MIFSTAAGGPDAARPAPVRRVNRLPSPGGHAWSPRAEPAWAPDRADGLPGNLHAAREVLASVREALSGPDPSVAGVLYAVQAALGAEELFLLCSRGDVCGAGVEVTAFPVRKEMWTLPGNAVADAATWGPGGPDQAAVRRMAMALGVGSKVWATGFVRLQDRDEVLLATWSERDVPRASAEVMDLAAEAVAMGRTSMRSHPSNVSAFLRRERTELAERLHDDLLQTVTGAILELETIGHGALGHAELDLESIDSVKVALRRSVAEMRGVIAALSQGRPLEDSSAGEVPGGLRGYVQSVVEQWGLSTRVVVEGDLDLAPDPVTALAHAVIREALANAAKHASTADVTVRLATTETDLTVSVIDKGRGFTPHEREKALQAHHLGLEMLQRRVAEHGGTLHVESTPGKGTRVVARIPIDEVAS